MSVVVTRAPDGHPKFCQTKRIVDKLFYEYGQHTIPGGTPDDVDFMYAFGSLDEVDISGEWLGLSASGASIWMTTLHIYDRYSFWPENGYSGIKIQDFMAAAEAKGILTPYNYELIVTDTTTVPYIAPS